VSPQTIGVSGDPASFSEEAALQYAQTAQLTPQLVYLTDMERVLSAVEAGTVDLGLFPVANQRGGLVKQALRAMGNHPFVPIDDFWFDVCQCLMVQRGVQRSHIRQIVSHPQALAQCPAFIRTHLPHAILREWDDTAKAAADLASGQLSSDCAVIAPKRAAALYGLDLVEEGIQDLKPNLTAFVVVKHR
jgi:prephenate dehydratase